MKTALLTGCLLLAAATTAFGGPCEDITKIGDRWHKLANYIDEHSDDGKLRKAEIRKVAAELRILVPPTKTLGEIVVQEFKGKEKELQRVNAWGQQILGALKELGAIDDDSDWDENVKIVDRLVDLIDKVGGIFCESQ